LSIGGGCWEVPLQYTLLKYPYTGWRGLDGSVLLDRAPPDGAGERFDPHPQITKKISMN
jgi:hypothetical protein